MSFKTRTEADFKVNVAKGGIVEFTDANLTLHKSIFNPDIRPEYFQDLSPYGLDYEDTILMEGSLIDAVLHLAVFGNQKYRSGHNTKYNQIKGSMLGNYDLREKPLQAVIDDDGNVEFLFNGNTTHNIFNSHTNVQNRLVAVYKKNRYFTPGRLILIGGRMNSIDYPSGTVTWDDIQKIIQGYLETGELTLSEKPSADEKKDFIAAIHKMIHFSSNGTITVNKSINTYINDTIEKITGILSVYGAKTGEDVIAHLADTYQMRSDDRMVYTGCTANSDKILEAWKNQYKRLCENYDLGVSKVKAEAVMVNTVIHMGVPDPADPVKDFFTTYLKLWKTWSEVDNFVQDVYTQGGKPSQLYNIIGAWQQVKELEDLCGWEFGSYVEFKDIVEEGKNRGYSV